jgi:hypothetical protein
MSLSFPQIITEIGEHDVLCGRGNSAVQNVGNISFRELVSARKAEYLSTNQRDVVTKNRIAREIVHVIRSNGGRFLRKHELFTTALNSEGGASKQKVATVYELVDEGTVLEKTKQALRQKASPSVTGAPSKSNSPESSSGKSDATTPPSTHNVGDRHQPPSESVPPEGPGLNGNASLHVQQQGGGGFENSQQWLCEQYHHHLQMLHYHSASLQQAVQDQKITWEAFENAHKMTRDGKHSEGHPQMMNNQHHPPYHPALPPPNHFAYAFPTDAMSMPYATTPAARRPSLPFATTPATTMPMPMPQMHYDAAPAASALSPSTYMQHMPFAATLAAAAPSTSTVIPAQPSAFSGGGNDQEMINDVRSQQQQLVARFRTNHHATAIQHIADTTTNTPSDGFISDSELKRLEAIFAQPASAPPNDLIDRKPPEMTSGKARHDVSCHMSIASTKKSNDDFLAEIEEMSFGSLSISLGDFTDLSTLNERSTAISKQTASKRESLETDEETIHEDRVHLSRARTASVSFNPYDASTTPKTNLPPKTLEKPRRKSLSAYYREVKNCSSIAPNPHEDVPTLHYMHRASSSDHLVDTLSFCSMSISDSLDFKSYRSSAQESN